VNRGYTTGSHLSAFTYSPDPAVLVYYKFFKMMGKWKKIAIENYKNPECCPLLLKV
jgi:hypothetical protein